MTQAITNIINNPEQLLTGTKQAANHNGSKNKFFDIPNFDWEKIQTAANSIHTQTTSVQEEKQLHFKNESKKAEKYTNNDTTSDLTLAKDIKEIVSQLKEAVNDAHNEQNIVTEESTTDTEFVSETTDTVDEDSENLYEQIAELPANLFAQLMEMNTAIKSENNVAQDSTTINNTTALAEKTADEIITSKPQDEGQTDTLEALMEEDKLKELNIESIKAETNTSDGESLMQHQTPEESALKAIINSHDNSNFEIKLEANTKTQPQPTEVSSGRILDQISKHIENLQNGSKVNIVLNPESLGKVDIRLLTTKEGLSAQFTVSTQEARDILLKGMDGLKETLAAHGVNCDNISVKVSDSQKSEYKEDWTEQEGSEGGNKNQEQTKKEEKDKGLFEKMMEETCES